MLDMLTERSIKIIYLKRRNKVLQALSQSIASQTQVWGINSPDRKKAYLVQWALTPIEIESIKDNVNRAQVFESKYDEHLKNRDIFEVYYEELYNVPSEQMFERLSAVLNFVRLAPDEDISDLARERFDSSRKQNSAEVFVRIPNIREIEEEFQSHSLNELST